MKVLSILVFIITYGHAQVNEMGASGYIGGGAGNPWDSPSNWNNLTFGVCWPYTPEVSSSKQACIDPLTQKKLNWKTLNPTANWLLDVGAGAQMSPWNPSKFKNIEGVLDDAKSVGYAGISYDVEYISPESVWGTGMCDAWNSHFQKVKAAGLMVHVTNAWTSMWTTAGTCNAFCDEVMQCILKSDHVDIISPQIYCNGPAWAGSCDYLNTPKPIPTQLSGSKITWDMYIAAANPKTKIMPVLTRTCSSSGSIYSNLYTACQTVPSPYKTFLTNINDFATYFCKKYGDRYCSDGFYWYPYFTA